MIGQKHLRWPGGAAMMCLLLALAGCARQRTARSQPVAPTTRPITPSLFASADYGIQLSLPDDWERRPSDDYVLLLVPADSAAAANNASISLDVPHLPPHIPGLIPISSVRGGYLDDLRQAHPDLQTQDLTPPAIREAKTRVVRSTWPQDDGQFVQTALLIVHDDHVYILRARTGAEHETATLHAWKQVVDSLTWISKQPGRSIDSSSALGSSPDGRDAPPVTR